MHRKTLTAKIDKCVVLRRSSLEKEGIKLSDWFHLVGRQEHFQAQEADRDPMSLVLLREQLASDAGWASVACDEHATGRRRAVLEGDDDGILFFFVLRKALPPLY